MVKKRLARFGLRMSPKSIGALAKGRDRLIPAALIAAGVLLASGLALPVMSVNNFFIFSSEFSILDSLLALFEAEEYFLFGVIFTFTIIFPITKLVYAGRLWARVDVDASNFDRTLDIIDTLGKWSMLDVLLLAVAVASIKLSVVGEAHTNPGLYLFCGAIILSMLGLQWLKAAGRRARAELSEP